MTEFMNTFQQHDPAEPVLEEALSIRTMTMEDLPLIILIDRHGSGRERTEFYGDKVASCIREPALNTSLIAEWDGVAVGFLFGRLHFGEFGMPVSMATLDALGVHPRQQHRGIGRAMMDQHQKNLEGLRVEAIETLVDWGRMDLLAFFRNNGFFPARAVDLIWDVTRYPFAGGSGGHKVRLAREEDLEAVGIIDRDEMLTSRSRYFSGKLEYARSHPDKNIFLVAEIKGQVAGFMVGSLFQGEFGIDSSRGVIESFGVGGAYRHRGVASAIMDFLLTRVNKLGISQMETLCRWNNWELLQFFEYVGFRPSPRLILEKPLT